MVSPHLPFFIPFPTFCVGTIHLIVYSVFNSFSFKKWAKYVREQRVEEEIRRQRMEQVPKHESHLLNSIIYFKVIRLRNKLIRERALRDQVDLLTDDDVDKLVHYMNTAGKSFAGIATGIQSTVRFGRRPSMAARKGEYYNFNLQ
jgi:hypothetical protein